MSKIEESLIDTDNEYKNGVLLRLKLYLIKKYENY
jgi:hypothetical protein